MIVYGINPVQEAFKSEQWRINRVLVRRDAGNSRLNALIEEARRTKVQVHFVPEEALNRKCNTSQHQGVLAEISEVKFWDVDALLASKPRVLLLPDGVEDPRNLGAVLRTSEAVGAGGVLLPTRNCCGLTPLVVKASAGAALHLPIARIGNVVQTLAKCREAGYWLVGLDMEGDQRAGDIPSDLPLVILIGGEDAGLRRLVRENCDFVVSLPLCGKVPSLNLSVAAGVLLYQLLESRQDRAPGPSRSPGDED